MSERARIVVIGSRKFPSAYLVKAFIATLPGDSEALRRLGRGLAPAAFEVRDYGHDLGRLRLISFRSAVRFGEGREGHASEVALPHHGSCDRGEAAPVDEVEQLE